MAYGENKYRQTPVKMKGCYFITEFRFHSFLNLESHPSGPVAVSLLYWGSKQNNGPTNQ